MAPKNPSIEIGLLLFPDVQLAAIYGLSDLFAVANHPLELRMGLSPGAYRTRFGGGRDAVLAGKIVK